ncbi:MULTISPECIES: YdaS family helix-turn-helix protein [unclassified Acinetobacter]|uniref:YdaS family helix-turn-helix protein n=1 Tax=unclassified Acinetobacter TaxID=196816 RepID=UPI0015D14B0C|nr:MULTISPECIES: YdaS family helix-turn-helix protein [unclassified Acinetobacter]
MIQSQTKLYQSLVEHFGSQECTAEALLVKQPAVSGWVRGTKKMSERVALRAEKSTDGKFKASDLCPALKEFNKLSV